MRYKKNQERRRGKKEKRDQSSDISSEGKARKRHRDGDIERNKNTTLQECEGVIALLLFCIKRQ